MGLAGDLREIPFSDVVQFYSHAKRTAVLVLSDPKSGEERGYFYFDHGELLDARLGDWEGLEAVYRALELKEGAFHVLADVEMPPRRIFKPIAAMLLEGMKRLDEEAAGRASRPAPQLKLVRFPLGTDDEGALEGEDMANGDQHDRVCPTCRKRYQHGEVCPADGARLMTITGSFERSELTPATTSAMPPAPVLPRRSRLAPSWWVAIVAVITMLSAFGIVWLRRAGMLSTSDRASAAGASSASRPPGAGATAAAVSAPGVTGPSGQEAPAGSVRGISDREIVFGMSSPLTGPAKELGRQMKLGVETAFQATNDAGGVHGRKLRLVALDDGYEPTRTATVMSELYDKEKVFGIVGNVGTPTAVVAVPFALQRNMLFYGAFTGANLLRRDPPDRYVINFRASYAEETAAVVKYLVKVRRIKPTQIAVFAQQDAFGDAGYAGVQKAMRGLRNDGGSVLRVGYVRNTVDVGEAVTRVMDHSAAIKAVVMVGTYRACAKFIEKIRDINPGMILSNVSFVGSTALAEELRLLGPKYADGVIVTQVVPPVESHSTAVLKYKAALENYFPGETPDYVSLEGYLAATVLVEALRRAGRDLDTERLVNAFEGIRGLELGIGTMISFGVGEHQGSHKVWGTQLNAKGEYEVIDLE